VTILGCTQDAEGRLRLLCAEGESLPGPRLRIGNTNSRIRFAQPPAMFVSRWCAEAPTHHCALGIGHLAPQLRLAADLLGLPLAAV
jgi:L-arabinose isomerase